MALRHFKRCFSSLTQPLMQPHSYYGFSPHPQSSQFAEKLKHLPLTTIVDALWTLKYPQPMIHGIEKITKEDQIENHVGLAITLRFVPYRNDLMPLKPQGYESPEYFAFDMVAKSTENYKYSIVMETCGKYESVGGDMKFAMLKNTSSISCVICDGGIRDIDNVSKYNIPIYASRITCKQGPATQIPWSVNEVIEIGDIVCVPYDFVVADKYNVVIVPQSNIDKVIDIANLREDIENIIQLEIKNNNDDGSIIPDYYPFPTPTSVNTSSKLVNLLKKYNKWDEIEARQNDIFS